MNLGDLRVAGAEMTQQPQAGRAARQILLGIATALEELRAEQVSFTVLEHPLTLVPGLGSYPLAATAIPAAGELPRDVWRILGNPVLDTDEELVEVGAQEIARDPARRQATPACWHFDGESLELSPLPYRESVLHLRYHADLGTPIPLRNGDTWELQVWGEAIDDTWSSPWTLEAWNLVVLRAASILCVDYLRDAEQGQAYVVRYQEGLRSLYKRHGRKSSPRIQPFEFYK